MTTSSSLSEDFPEFENSPISRFLLSSSPSHLLNANMHLILLRALQYALVVLPLFTSAQDTTSPPASLSTTLSQSVISSNPSASPTSASIPPAPTVNSTVGTSQDLFLWPPQGGLRQCERVTFSFTKPAVPLTVRSSPSSYPLRTKLTIYPK